MEPLDISSAVENDIVRFIGHPDWNENNSNFTINKLYVVSSPIRSGEVSRVFVKADDSNRGNGIGSSLFELIPTLPAEQAQVGDKLICIGPSMPHTSIGTIQACSKQFDGYRMCIDDNHYTPGHWRLLPSDYDKQQPRSLSPTRPFTLHPY